MTCLLRRSPRSNNIARDVALERHYSLIETARLLAQMNVSMNDGVQTSHTSKFIYGLWRPVTAIPSVYTAAGSTYDG